MSNTTLALAGSVCATHFFQAQSLRLLHKNALDSLRLMHILGMGVSGASKGWSSETSLFPIEIILSLNRKCLRQVVGFHVKNAWDADWD